MTPDVKARAGGLFFIFLGMLAFLFGVLAAVPVTIMSQGRDLWSYLLEEFKVNGLARSCIVAGGLIIIVGVIRLVRSRG